MLTRHAFFVLCVPLGVMVSLSACSKTTRHRLLTFFLDGVPQPGEGGEVPAPVSGPVSAGPRRTAIASSASVHPPFRKNDCNACHKQRTGELRRSLQEGFCQICHRQLPGDVTYVHGPAAVGDCLFCHHYHNAAIPMLLLADATQLCFRCHAAEDLTAGRHHAAIDAHPCIECHDPHGGENAYFLKPRDDWGAYLHGPVAVSDCDSCHDGRASGGSESSGDERLSLCFRCHRREDLTAGSHHAAIGAQPCTACHDPHGGADRFFLRRSQP